jgi:hypothetical protein
MKKHLFLLIISILPFSLSAQKINWKELVSKQDLTWNNNVDSSFFNGAFIGDGIQGAMIMQDTKNPNGLRMLLSHYKAISHSIIPKLEFCDSKLYAGNIIIAPVGKQTNQTMRMNLYDGEASGTINTENGSIVWRAFAERKNNVFVVELKGTNGEKAAKLGVREEWGITPRFYIRKQNISDYAEYLPPKPELTKQNSIDLVINKMKKLGAHVLASKLITKADDTQILYLAIGTSDNADVDIAATEATTDAVARVQAAVNEGYVAITKRHQEWWHKYMQSSYLEIKDDPYWQKIWYIQLYKFACSSSEKSDLIMDTQGAWIWGSAWAAIWWNLNVQLSYIPMFTANKLDVGKSYITCIDRMYKSGALSKNAKGKGIYIGRLSTYDGIGTFGDELGNLPWLLQLYWRYWKYSGDDAIGKSLFPMLKDNAEFLITRLQKGADGKYHLDPSRSPEYEDVSKIPLSPDANYGLMSVSWVFQTLLTMDKELKFNDPKRKDWQEKLDNLAAFPTNENGYMVNADMGFDGGHRHASHLMSIYPYHTVNPEQGQNARELIEKSTNRWYNLTEANGYAGFSFTKACMIYATLGNGDKALATIESMKQKKLMQPNTMYFESGGAVIETPLSLVESIDYMLLQSWNGIIRIFPAVPEKWKNIAFNDFRAQGAFLVSAKFENNTISNVLVRSEKGKTCIIKNPWKGKMLIVKDQNGKRIKTTIANDIITFKTKVGNKYSITHI